MPYTQRDSASGSADLLSSVRALSPTQFEHWVADMLRLHFPSANVRAMGGSGDRGVDVVVDDPQGPIVVQCKRYAPRQLVGSRDMQMFLGAMMHRDTTRGAFVTTSGFTAEARAIGKSHGIWLVDAGELSKLASKYDPAIRERKRLAQVEAERLREQRCREEAERHEAYQRRRAVQYVKYEQDVRAAKEERQKRARREAIKRKIACFFSMWFLLSLLALLVVPFVIAWVWHIVPDGPIPLVPAILGVTALASFLGCHTAR